MVLQHHALAPTLSSLARTPSESVQSARWPGPAFNSTQPPLQTIPKTISQKAMVILNSLTFNWSSQEWFIYYIKQQCTNLSGV